MRRGRVGEELASLGFGTPLVVEQVTTLVASWAAKIARWLNALLASLRRPVPIIRRLDQLINDLKKILGRLRGHGDEPPRMPRRGESRQDLLDELERNRVKHNPDDIVETGRNEAGQIVFLEKGDSRSGLQHILDGHAKDFANVGHRRTKSRN